MAPLLASPSKGIRTYCDRLRILGGALSGDPLSEHHTTALVNHIVNNWGNALYLRDVLRTETPVQTSELPGLLPPEHSTPATADDDHTSLTIYCDKLRELITDLLDDPLSDSRTLMLLEHICNHRTYAVYLQQLIATDTDPQDATGSAASIAPQRGR